MRGRRALGAALDVLLAPAALGAAGVMRGLRRVGLHNLPASRALLRAVGIFPLRRHYYDPFPDPAALARPLDAERDLPGIRWNVEGQLALLARLRYADELAAIPHARRRDGEFYFDNSSFVSGDAEYLYGIVRHVRPRRLLEIGSGNSTLMAMQAIRANVGDDPDYRCEVTCVEPYEQPWLESLGVRVIRERVETLGPEPFAALESGDILFIDSSHVVRPQGDVLFLLLGVLPTLRPGVLVHVHDIFTPSDYPTRWVVDEARLWTEQYVLEAFLSCNDAFEVIGALSYLHRHHFEALRAACPYVLPDRAPGSMWIRRR